MRRIIYLAATGLMVLLLVWANRDGARPPAQAVGGAAPGGSAQPGGPPVSLTALLVAEPRLAMGDHRGIVYVRDAATGAETLRWVAHDGPVRRIQADVEGLLSVGADGTAASWTWTGEPRGRRRLVGAHFSDGVATPAGVFVAADRGSVALLGDAEKLWDSVGFHGSGAFATAWSPAGPQVASGGKDGRIALWQLAGGVPVRDWIGDPDAITSLLWTERGLYSGGAQGAVVGWDPATGVAQARFPGHTAAVVALAASPTALLSGGEDTTARLFTLEAVPGPVLKVTAAVRAVALRSDRAWVGSADGRICRFRVADGAAEGCF